MCVIYHNSRCSKSRATLEILERSDKDFQIINYLNHPPSKEELQEILEHTGLSAKEFIRSGEKLFKELQLSGSSEEQLINAMLAHPILIERPIVKTSRGVRIGRPPENVLEIL